MATEERSIFDGDGVRVTTARIMFGSQTYAVSAVNSVDWRVEPAAVTVAILLIVFGSAFCLFGVLAIIASGSEISGCSAGFALGGFCAIAGGVLRMRDAKATQVVILSTSSGQYQVFRTFDASLAQRIVTAINEAIVARG